MEHTETRRKGVILVRLEHVVVLVAVIVVDLVVVNFVGSVVF